jgi:PAS domain S-box-containing protein
MLRFPNWRRISADSTSNRVEWQRLVLAGILPVLVFVFQWAYWQIIQPYAWFLFFPTVFLAVLIGHLWGGILATVLSTLLVWYFFLPPQISFGLESPWLFIPIGVFVTSGIIVSYVHEHLYLRARRAARLAGEARFQLLFEQAMDGMIVTAANGDFIEVNSRLCAMVGYSRDELVGQNIARLIPECDLERLAAAAAPGGLLSAIPSKWRLQTKWGTRCPVEVTAGRFADGCWSAIVRDVSERYLAEAQERAAEEKFHAFMDAIPAVAWIKDADGNYAYLNKAWGEALGTSREQWLGKHPSALMPAAVVARLAEADVAVYAKGEAIESEEETVDPAGRRRLWQSIKFPIFTPGSPTMLGGVAIDITELRQSEMALQASAELNRAVLDSIGAQMAVLDRDGEIIAVNAAWERFASENGGLPMDGRRTGVGSNFLEVCRCASCDEAEEGVDGATVERAVLDVLQGRIGHFVAECLCATPGARLWFSLNVRPLRSSAGGAVVSYFDISELKRSQELQHTATAQLQAMTAKYLALQEEEKRLLSLELHDHIGQTLTSLQLHLHSLFSVLGDSARGRMIIHEGVANVEELIETTRDIARRLRPPVLDDLGLASAVRWHVSQIADSTDICIDLQHNLQDQRLAPALELACFRVLQEAVSNVLRHSKAAKLSIALSLEIDGLHLSIKDDGIGFDLDETFRKLRTLASLGLIGMRERVTALGGHFNINTRPGFGTEVAALFPLPP